MNIIINVLKNVHLKLIILIIFAINFYALFIIIMNKMGASMKYHKDFI